MRISIARRERVAKTCKPVGRIWMRRASDSWGTVKDGKPKEELLKIISRTGVRAPVRNEAKIGFRTKVLGDSHHGLVSDSVSQ